MLTFRSVWTLCVLALLLPLGVLSQLNFDLTDALDDDNLKPSASVGPKPEAPTRGAEQTTVRTTTTKVPVNVRPKLPASTAVSKKTKPKSTGQDFDLADALDQNQKPGGGFSNSDLEDVSNDNTYKPDKGKGGYKKGDASQSSHGENNEVAPEVGTIAGIVSAVGMALVGAITSYISYQKKKLCFSIQQSLNVDINKAEIPEGVVATEPQAQQTLLEQPKSGPPCDDNTV
ncbi:CD99 antigen-like protein 2 isoform X1 [Poeciliopsis prolifica]|uniref:CD99 antigen-like protein 2 isoform X1 n=1 Tax=Poeciliopsis prolifica TaxID=188132 RepID=UPI0024142721|nr:CD99 antigen-like protein 2 isoform X1 [Poeciliopsis prolifica]